MAVQDIIGAVISAMPPPALATRTPRPTPGSTPPLPSPPSIRCSGTDATMPAYRMCRSRRNTRLRWPPAIFGLGRELRGGLERWVGYDDDRVKCPKVVEVIWSVVGRTRH
ncbi:hypothetical protein BC938DRAFT_482477 [Jimgerdemannia flammicorona]|uniref:Uncharacterized protein n=1 Tax=Jimgerdemannia flammicorona TaxID=994334 RepID=A0A433QDY8_9FUNG|nr:hypothetical protein BC938DRAFT_482477 [Jimgerdemannia flammicorona]